MNPTKPERRLTRRLSLRIPLSLRVGESSNLELQAESIDFSERGVLLQTDSALLVGSKVELYLKMPQETTGEPKIEWRCGGHVVHVALDTSSNGTVRAGVRFNWLKVLRNGG